MTQHGAPSDGPSGGTGTWTAADGTPYPVDVARDRPTRITWVVFLGGPVIWFVHFMVVYLVAEAGCTGDGPGLNVFDPPVPATVTLATTAVAAAGCLGFAAWAHRWWRASRDGPAADDAPELSGGLAERDRGGTLAFAGFLLSLGSFVAVLFVGLPAFVLEC